VNPSKDVRVQHPSRQTLLIGRARQGDVDAFSRLVREYQDMAVGYAVSLLGDFHAAEDAAQEAFVAAHAKLANLRDPVAFPAWFRAIVRTACTRSIRRQQKTVCLDDVEEPVHMDATAEDAASETQLMVALRSLPETERAVLALFYVSRYSHREIARFLDIRETTVQGRLRTGRKRLQERMWKMAEEELREGAPSRDSRFTDRVKRLVRPDELKSEDESDWAGGRGTDVWEMFTAAIHGDLQTVQKLVRQNPRLVGCSHQYRTPLHFAVQENQIDVARFLLQQGADAAYNSGNAWHGRPVAIAEERGHEAMHQLLLDHLAQSAGVDEGGERIAAVIRQRDVAVVRDMLATEPALLHAGDDRGNRPIHWAVMVRSIPMIDLVLQEGADINAMRPDGARPLDLTNGDYFHRGGRDVPAVALSTHEVLVGYLIARGADYDISVAAKVGDTERVSHLLQQDRSLANRVPPYSTYSTGLALRNSCMRNDSETVQVLLDAGADPSTPEPGIAPKGGALHAAASRGNLDICRMLLERGADPNADVESSGTCMSSARGNSEILELLAMYGGEFPEYQDLAEIPMPALVAVYGEALPLRYFVDIADMQTLTLRLREEPEHVGNVLRMALRKYGPPTRDVVRLCLDIDPTAARQVHANDLIYNLRRAEGVGDILTVLGWLLEAGMTPDDSDWLRVTSLHRLAIGSVQHGSDGSVYRPHLDVMQLFIEAGADLHARDEEYRSTPLGWAARWGRRESVELLLARGARTNLPDDPPWATPLAWARQKGHLEIEQLLRDSGATH
jgi:RNA polymerase sigma factor (sigma-70 family)